MYRPQLTKLTKQFKHGKMSPNFFFPSFFDLFMWWKIREMLQKPFETETLPKPLKKKGILIGTRLHLILWDGVVEVLHLTLVAFLCHWRRLFLFLFLFYFILFYKNKNKNKIQVAVLCCSFMSEYDIRKVVIPFTLSSLSFSLINSDNDAYGSRFFLPGIFGCCWPTCNH